MPNRRRLTLSLAALSLAASVWAGSCLSITPSCPACDRTECVNLAFTIHSEGGGRTQTCCPRCGIHYLASNKLRAVSLNVRDFDTAADLDARRAFYVEGSEIAPCLSNRTDMPKDPRGCCLSPVYDRCLPSLLAFGSRERAESFAREHQGIVRTFGELGFPATSVPSGGTSEG